jgi:hypothetical protein
MHMKNGPAGRFCAWPETFTLILQSSLRREFHECANFHSWRGFWRKSEVQIETVFSFVKERTEEPVSPKLFCFRYNFGDTIQNDAPVAQLDRAHGYEP